ncbi:MAG: penicillin acylase family protein [bacterium]
MIRRSRGRLWVSVSLALLTACGSGGGGNAGADATKLEGVGVTSEISLPGLGGRVDAIRDVYGIHHIYPRDVSRDGAFINGYIQAHERLFQMDFLRKVAQGRLTELLGELDSSVLGTSVYFRTLFTTPDGGRIEDALVEETATSRPELLDFLKAYCEGINAYLDDLDAGRNGAVLPQQYKLINTLFSLGSPYSIERWEPKDVLILGRLQQWDLSQTLGSEIDRAARLAALRNAESQGAIPSGTAEDVERFEPINPATTLPPDEIPAFTVPPPAAKVGTSAKRAAALPTIDPALARRIVASENRARSMSPFGRERAGSNNWIVSGALTESGHAMLANDPHLALPNPSTFYFLHLDDKTFAGGHIDAHGAGFPGIPGILLGQNRTLAWGGTVANFDVVDVYVEQVSGSGSNKKVVFGGREVAVKTIQQSYTVRQLVGGKPKTITQPIDIVPHHGPQVPDPDPSDAITGLESVGNMTFRWTGHLVTRDVAAFYDLMQSDDIDGFFQALTNFGVGAQNFVGADAAGNIGYFPHALVPLRAAAVMTPELGPWSPLPGTGEYEWQTNADGTPRFLPDDRIPQSRNPERGWLVTANNDQIGGIADNDLLDDGIYLGWDHTEGLRAGRVQQRIEEFLGQGKISFLDMLAIQNDHVSLAGLEFAPRIVEALDDAAARDGLAVPGSLLDQAKRRLSAWSGDCPIGVEEALTGTKPSNEEINDSVACSIFHAWGGRLAERLLGDELAAAGLSPFSTRTTLTVLHHLLADVAETGSLRVATLGEAGQSRLFDDIRTPEVESPNRTLALAMADAIQDLTSFFGSDDPDRWRWGSAHTSTFEDLALGSILPVFNLPSAPITASTPRGYPRAGAIETVDPAGVDGPPPWSPGSGPVMRHVIELTPDGTTAVNVLPGGQNDLDPDKGLFNPVKIDPAIHYGDQLARWLSNDRREQWIALDDVVAHAEARIRFVP